MRGVLFAFVMALCVRQVAAQSVNLPKLGAEVAAYIEKSRLNSQQCLTDINRHDPCASLKVGNTLFTIAWDARTKAITYLFTSDTHLITDSELMVGGSCRLLDESGKPYKVTHYRDWLVTSQWMDTVGTLSGDAIWYVALKKESANAKYGRIAGFVQSRYLKIGQQTAPTIDPERSSPKYLTKSRPSQSQRSQAKLEMFLSRTRQPICFRRWESES